MRWRAEIRGFATALSLVAIALLVAVSIDFGIPGQSLLQTLRFHMALAALIFPAVLVLVGARWRAGLVVLAIGASLGQGAMLIGSLQQQRMPLLDQPVAASVDVISFNAYFDNARPGDLADFIVSSAPDIAVVMEADALRNALGDVLPYQAGCRAGKRCDLAIFSKTPLDDIVIRSLPPIGRDRLVIARTEIDGQQVHIVGLHLSKPYFDRAAEIELEQAYWWTRNIEGPVILAGDFNAAGWSSAVVNFARLLDYAPPPAYPATWPVPLDAFGVPIDNMMTRGPALIRDIAATPSSFGSNHRGLRATVDLF